VALELAGPDLLVAADPDGASDQATVGELLTRAPKRFSYASADRRPSQGDSKELELAVDPLELRRSKVDEHESGSGDEVANHP